MTTLILYSWALLLAGLLGAIMGINRTLKTREHESPVLQTLSTFAGILLIALSAYSMFTAGGTVGGSRYVIPFMMVLGLSLCARWLERVPVTAVLLLVLGLGILYALGQGGMPQSVTELFQKQNTRKLMIIAAIVAGGAVILLLTTVEKVVDLVLDLLGQGLVVTVISVIGAAHAVLVLSTGNSRGLLRFL